MKTNKPLIGITPGYDYKKSLAFVRPGYCEGLIEAGGQPVVISHTSCRDILDDIFDRLDGILISGGPDIDAGYYGEPNLPFNGEISPVRDSMEIYLIKKAILSLKPVFGICRGIQVINVAAGGTLYQDIHSQIKDVPVIKHSQEAPKWYPTHDIEITGGVHVASSFNEKKIRVNSFHHQAIKDIAPDFIEVARSQDGIIEAIEHKSHRFAVGVQWHPELMWEKNRIYLDIFKLFINSCI